MINLQQIYFNFEFINQNKIIKKNTHPLMFKRYNFIEKRCSPLVSFDCRAFFTQNYTNNFM